MIARSARWPLALTAVLLVAGCAQVPTSGPVRQGEDVQAGVDEPFIRVLPQVPTPDMSPLAVVRGFLSASASFDGDHAVARDFLTPQAAADWNPGAGVVVLDDQQGYTLRSVGSRRVLLAAKVVATIDRDGSLTPTRATRTARTMRLMKVDGEWRIVDPPNRLYLTRLDVARSYRALDLYFVSPGSPFLVPDPVYVPIVRPGAATSLVRALLDGPTPWLAPAVRTAFPAGTGLVVDSVPVENGVAQVNLSSAVLQASESELSVLTAQLVWTLSQLPEVTAVRLQSEGVPLTVAQSTAPQTTRDWAGFDPSLPPTQSSGIAVNNGRLVQLTSPQPTPIEGFLGSGALSVTQPAISWTAERIAAVTADDRSLYVQQQSDPGKGSLVYSGEQLATPSFDGAGNLWWVDQRATGSRVLMQLTGAGGRVVRVQIPDVGQRRIAQLRVTRDGTRAALVLSNRRGDGELVLARILRSASQIALNGFRPLERRLTEVASIAWASDDQIAVLAQQHGAAIQPWLVGVDATVTATGGSLPGAVDLAAAPGVPLLAATADGRVWADTGLSWREVARATQPAYAG